MKPEAPKQIKPIDQLVQMNNEVVNGLTALQTAGQYTNETPTNKGRISALERLASQQASLTNLIVVVLKEHEALIDKLGDLVDGLTPDATQLEETDTEIAERLMRQHSDRTDKKAD